MKIGQSTSFLKYQGCLITALCMVYSKWHPPYYPSQATKEWKFSGNLLDWFTDFKGMKFVERVWSYDNDTVRKLVKDGFGVVIQVQTKSGVHWLAVWDWGYQNKPVVHDPWDARVLYNPWGILGRYVRPLGYAVLKKCS